MMRSGLKSLLLTLVVAALAGGAGAWASASWILREREAPSLHALLHDDLDLTADQKVRLEAAEARFAGERRKLEGAVRAANRELAGAIAASEGDGPAVQAAVDHVHDAMGALQKATIAHVFEMRSILTPAQAEAFDARVGRALLREAEG